jgi:hypothetical protein
MRLQGGGRDMRRGRKEFIIGTENRGMVTTKALSTRRARLVIIPTEEEGRLGELSGRRLCPGIEGRRRGMGGDGTRWHRNSRIKSERGWRRRQGGEDKMEDKREGEGFTRLSFEGDDGQWL